MLSCPSRLEEMTMSVAARQFDGVARKLRWWFGGVWWVYDEPPCVFFSGLEVNFGGGESFC